MTRPITAYGFRGMNNLPRVPAKLLDDARFITPQVVINADVSDEGVVARRKGHVKKIPLRRCHSLWAGSVMLCVAEGLNYPQALYRIEGGRALEVCVVTGPRVPLSYLEAGTKVYLGNPYWTGAYHLNSQEVKPWGLPLPPAPVVSLVDGDLPPGTYKVCYTGVQDNQLSGNGPWVEVSWEGISQGLQLQEVPENVLAWITQPNEGDFFLAPVEAGNRILSPCYLQRLPTLFVIPAPGMAHFVMAFGRVWGVAGTDLYYSEPFQFDRFKKANRVPFSEELVMVAPFLDGLYVNSRHSSWVLEGTAPEKMAIKRIGDGAVPGTLTYALVEGGGYEISKQLSQLPSPIWMSSTGLVVGSQHGHLVHLTEARLKVLTRQRGVALTRTIGGLPQTLISMSGLLQSEGDAALQEVFSRGRICPPEPLAVTLEGGVIVGGEFL